MNKTSSQVAISTFRLLGSTNMTGEALAEWAPVLFRAAESLESELRALRAEVDILRAHGDLKIMLANAGLALTYRTDNPQETSAS